MRRYTIIHTILIQNSCYPVPDIFDHIFNIEDFKQRRNEAYAWLLMTKDGDQLDDNAVFARDLYRIALGKGYIPHEAYIIYKREKRKEILRKIKRRIKRIIN